MTIKSKLKDTRSRASDLRWFPQHLLNVYTEQGSPSRSGGPRLFNVDLHIGPINDFRTITTPMGVGLIDWTISDHAKLMGRHREPIVGFNASNWHELSPTVIEKFLRRYGKYLQKFDGFVVTHTPVFAALFRPLQKPILVINSTRYEQPFTAKKEMRDWLDDELRLGAAEGQIHFVSNNLGDQAYLKHFTGIDSSYIPSLCQYTNAPYKPELPHFAISSRSRTIREVIASQTNYLAKSAADLVPSPSSWRIRNSVRGWIHIPYNISQMAIFEQYWENVPVYIPDDELLLQLWSAHPRGVLSELSMYQIQKISTINLQEGDPNRIHDPTVIRWWLARSDFGPLGELSGIVRFSSHEHLSHLLNSQDDVLQSESIRSSNLIREQVVKGKWNDALQSIWKL